MFIAVNRISAPAGMVQKMIEGFRHAAPEMKRFGGFLGLELWTSPEGVIEAVSRWETREALDEYLKHDIFAAHHGGASSEQMNVSNQVSYYSAEVLS